MTDSFRIESCSEIGEEHIEAALESRGAMRALLTAASDVSAPMEGVPKVLLPLARMATKACEWLEGSLRIEISGNDEESLIEVMADLGGGLRERVFPPLSFQAPLDEFVRALRLAPRLIFPLKLKERAGVLVLTATEKVRRSTAPPPPIEIGEESLYKRRQSSKQMPAVKGTQEPSPDSTAPARRVRDSPSHRPTALRMQAVRPEDMLALKTPAPPTRVARAPDAHNKSTALRIPVVAPSSVESSPTPKAPLAAPAKLARPPIPRNDEDEDDVDSGW